MEVITLSGTTAQLRVPGEWAQGLKLRPQLGAEVLQAVVGIHEAELSSTEASIKRKLHEIISKDKAELGPAPRWEVPKDFSDKLLRLGESIAPVYWDDERITSAPQWKLLHESLQLWAEKLSDMLGSILVETQRMANSAANTVQLSGAEIFYNTEMAKLVMKITKSSEVFKDAYLHIRAYLDIPNPRPSAMIRFGARPSIVTSNLDGLMVIRRELIENERAVHPDIIHSLIL